MGFRKGALMGGAALCVLGQLMVPKQAISAEAVQVAPPDQSPSSGQSGSAQSAAVTQVEEVVVTAQKRTERLSDVPISVTAESGALLKTQGVTSPAELTKVVPGLTYQNSTFGVPVFTIRGIGLYDTFVGASPTVTVYSDQVPLPYLAMTEGAGLDVDRVEVLKGPQGTLFGQNSTGGAINYVPAKPTGKPSAGFDVSYGRFNQLDADGYVSGPLTDTLGVRLAVEHEGRDGWQQSQSRSRDTLGRRDFTAVRLLTDWRPNDRLKVELNLNTWLDTSETQAAQFVQFSPTVPSPPGYPGPQNAIGTRAPAPNDARVADWDAGTPLHRHDSFVQGAIRADYKANDTLTLTSITAYSRYRTYAPTDSDGTNFDDFLLTIDANITSFSQEVRASADLPFAKVTAGGNYQFDRVDDADRVKYMGSNSALGPFQTTSFANLADQNVKTYAIFGNVDVPITSTLTAQGGVRYTQQDRSFQGCLADGGDGAEANLIAFFPEILQPGHAYLPQAKGACISLDPATLNPAGAIRENLNESNVSWRAGLDYKPWRNLLLYANVTKGYKSGAFTPLPAVFSSQLQPVTQESVLAYEAGVKTPLFEQRVELSAAAFYYDYTNKQVLGSLSFPIFGALPALQNIPTSSVKGVEVEATARPFQHLRTMLGATYVNSNVDGRVSAVDPYNSPIDLKNESFPNTPKWQVVGDAEYDMPLTPTLNGFVGGHLTYRSSSYAAFGENAAFVLPDVTLLDLRAGVEDPSGRWRLQVWGHNVSNEFYLTNVARYVDAVSRTTGMPTTYGVTLSGKF